MFQRLIQPAFELVIDRKEEKFRQVVLVFGDVRVLLYQLLSHGDGLLEHADPR